MKTKTIENIHKTIQYLKYGSVSGYVPSNEDIVELLSEILYDFNDCVNEAINNESDEDDDNLSDISDEVLNIKAETSYIQEELENILTIYPDFEENIDRIKESLYNIDSSADDIKFYTFT